ncbi:hypothetical protein EV121DRAFT_274863, partial [Schizophyllum commune]
THGGCEDSVAQYLIDDKHTSTVPSWRFHNHNGCARGEKCTVSHAPDEKSARDAVRADLPPNGWWDDPHQKDTVRKGVRSALRKSGNNYARRGDTDVDTSYCLTLRDVWGGTLGEEDGEEGEGVKVNEERGLRGGVFTPDAHMDAMASILYAKIWKRAGIRALERDKQGLGTPLELKEGRGGASSWPGLKSGAATPLRVHTEGVEE